MQYYVPWTFHSYNNGDKMGTKLCDHFYGNTWNRGLISSRLHLLYGGDNIDAHSWSGPVYQTRGPLNVFQETIKFTSEVSDTAVNFLNVTGHKEKQLKSRRLGECLFISSLQGRALRTLVDIARLAERLNKCFLIPLFHTGPESHELTNIWIRGWIVLSLWRS